MFTTFAVWKIFTNLISSPIWLEKGFRKINLYLVLDSHSVCPFQKFRRPTINRINFETSDNILKCLKYLEQIILHGICRTNVILLQVIEIYENKLPLYLGNYEQAKIWW